LQTTTADNSWAIVAAWRRLYGVHDKEKEEDLEYLEQFLREEIDIAPVESPAVVQARLEFSREYFTYRAQPATNERTEREVIQQPNLQVPDGEEYLYFAQ
jgi:hypothetical protein